MKFTKVLRVKDSTVLARIRERKEAYMSSYFFEQYLQILGKEDVLPKRFKASRQQALIDPVLHDMLESYADLHDQIMTTLGPEIEKKSKKEDKKNLFLNSLQENAEKHSGEYTPEENGQDRHLRYFDVDPNNIYPSQAKTYHERMTLKQSGLKDDWDKIDSQLKKINLLETYIDMAWQGKGDFLPKIRNTIGKLEIADLKVINEFIAFIKFAKKQTELKSPDYFQYFVKANAKAFSEGWHEKFSQNQQNSRTETNTSDGLPGEVDFLLETSVDPKDFLSRLKKRFTRKEWGAFVNEVLKGLKPSEEIAIAHKVFAGKNAIEGVTTELYTAVTIDHDPDKVGEVILRAKNIEGLSQKKHQTLITEVAFLINEMDGALTVENGNIYAQLLSFKKHLSIEKK